MAGIDIVAKGTRKMGDMLEQRQWTRTARFFRAASSAISVVRFAAPVISIFNQPDWQMTGEVLARTTAAIGTGIATQVVTEQLGNKVMKNLL